MTAGHRGSHPPFAAGDRDDPATLVLARDPSSVRAARRWLDELLQGTIVAGRVASDASLVLSELVTNALRHGLGEITVRAGVNDRRRAGAGRHRRLSGVAETTAAPAAPFVGRLRAAHRRTDRRRWGVEQLSGGKTVWATLTVP